MALPAKKRTRTSKRQRASHFALDKISVVKCEKCGQPSRPHRACPNCGYYKGKMVIDVKSKDNKKSK